MFWCFLSFYFINHIESFLYFALWVLRQWMFGFALTVSHSTTTHANSLSGIDSHLKALHARKLFPRSETKLTSASEELLIWCTEAEIICIKCGYFNILQCNKSLSLWYPLLRLGHATVIIGYQSGWFSDGKKIILHALIPSLTCSVTFILVSKGSMSGLSTGKQILLAVFRKRDLVSVAYMKERKCFPTVRSETPSLSWEQLASTCTAKMTQTLHFPSH